MSERDDKLQEALREAAAEFLAREAGPQSLVTVTRAALSTDARHGTVFITVLPESAEAGALAFANRNRDALMKYFDRRVRGARMPRVEFAIDEGQKAAQRLDELPR